MSHSAAIAYTRSAKHVVPRSFSSFPSLQAAYDVAARAGAFPLALAAAQLAMQLLGQAHGDGRGSKEDAAAEDGAEAARHQRSTALSLARDSLAARLAAASGGVKSVALCGAELGGAAEESGRGAMPRALAQAVLQDVQWLCGRLAAPGLAAADGGWTASEQASATVVQGTSLPGPTRVYSFGMRCSRGVSWTGCLCLQEVLVWARDLALCVGEAALEAGEAELEPSQWRGAAAALTCARQLHRELDGEGGKHGAIAATRLQVRVARISARNCARASLHLSARSSAESDEACTSELDGSPVLCAAAPARLCGCSHVERSRRGAGCRQLWRIRTCHWGRAQLGACGAGAAGGRWRACRGARGECAVRAGGLCGG